jgi:phosphate/sulfate permease
MILPQSRIIWAWIFTLPATGLIGYLLTRMFL